MIPEKTLTAKCCILTNGEFWIKITDRIICYGKKDEMLNSKFWDLYAIAYSRLIGFWAPHQDMFQDVIDVLDLHGKMHLLDVGCGAGDFEVKLFQQGITPFVEALDFSPRMLKSARRKCRKFQGISFHQADLNDPLPYPNDFFSRIICSQTLYALPRPKSTMLELRRVLKPGGKLIITEPKPEFDSEAIVRYHLEAQRTSKLVTRLKLLPYLSLIMLTLHCNKLISETYKAFTREELVNLVEMAGLDVLRVKETLAGQDWLLIATKGS